MGKLVGDSVCCAACGKPHVIGIWWPRHPFKHKPDDVDPKTLNADGVNDGKYPCNECGERTMFGSPLPDSPTCGDCMERRTPLKRRIAELEAQVASFQTGVVPTFEQAWQLKEQQGYKYGADALTGVRFGWQIRSAYADRVSLTSVRAVQTALLHQTQLASRWQALAEGRILAGLQVMLAMATGSPHGSTMNPLDILESLEECIIHAGTKGPPLTPAEEAHLHSGFASSQAKTKGDD